MIIAQFPDVDQFRWTAWFEVIGGAIMLLLAMLFQDLHHFCSKGHCTCKKKSLPSVVEVETDTKSKEQADHVKQRTPPMVIFVSSFT